jgi:hypothetical protein
MARPRKENPEPLVNFTARFPEKLHADLKVIADKENRSLIGQVLFILKNFVSDYSKDKEK